MGARAERVELASEASPPRRLTLFARAAGAARAQFREHPDVHETLGGAALVLAGKILGAALSFAFNLSLARLAGAEGAGLYFLAASVALVAATFGRIGLDQSVMRFSASSARLSDWRRLAGVHRQGVLIALAGSSLASLLVLLAAPWLARVAFHAPDLALPLRVMALAVVPLSLVELYAQLLYGIGRNREATLMQAIARPLFATILLFAFARGYGVVGAVAAFALANAGTLAIGAWAWRRATPQLRGETAEFDAWLLARSSLALLWAAAFNIVIATTDTLMLGVWRPSEEVGVYATALRTAAVASMAAIAVNSVVGPRFAALWAEGDRRGTQRLMNGVTLAMLLLATLILAGSLVLAGPIMGLFGSEFVEGAPAFRILAIGEFVALATGPTSYLLLMTGHERLYRNVVIGTALLNVAVNALLIPILGLVGAACATTASVVAKNAVYLLAVKRKLGFLPIDLGSLRARSRGGREDRTNREDSQDSEPTS